jgi:hypothetical protein
MSKNNMRKTQNNKKEDGNFKKVNIKHGQEESARAVFNPRIEEDNHNLE